MVPKKILWSLLFSVVVGGSVGFQQATVAITTADTLNVRETPGGEVIDQLGLATRVVIARTDSGWAEVLYRSNSYSSEMESGWVSLQYLRRYRGSSGGISSTCEDEYRSGAEVCLEVTDRDLDCDEEYGDDVYDDCEVEVDYELSTDYRGQSSIGVDVSCEAEISYKERDGYRSSSDSEDDYYSHNLYQSGSEYGSMDFDFRFSSYDEVYQVDLESAECEIQDLTLR